MDDAEGVRWVSYVELAELRGISKRSAVRMAHRRHWARREGNDGTARVAVPTAELAPRDGAGDGAIDGAGSGIAHGAGADAISIKVLEDAVAELRTRAERDRLDLERERARADTAEDELGRLLSVPGVQTLERLWRRWRRA
jgi:hypothetical protein